MKIQLIIFIVASIIFLYISRKSILALRSHGFYRFFAWESILALILINLPVWFLNPVAINQIASWLVLFVSVFLLIHGITLLSIIGDPSKRREDRKLIGFEKTTFLVTIGAYKYIRHPLYSSLFFLGWGAFFKAPSSLLGTGLVLSATVFLFLTAKVEETECVNYFGSEYQQYMKQTKRFIPFIF